MRFEQIDYKLDVVGGAIFINKSRDTIIIPYRIDMTDMTLKFQYWFKAGGVLSEWGSIEELEEYDVVNLSRIRNPERISVFEEDDIMQILKEYEDEPVHEDILAKLKYNLIDLRDGDLVRIYFGDYSAHEYEFNIEDGKFKLIPLEDDCDKIFDFGDYNRRHFEENIIGKLVKKEIKDMCIIE